MTDLSYLGSETCRHDPFSLTEDALAVKLSTVEVGVAVVDVEDESELESSCHTQWPGAKSMEYPKAPPWTSRNSGVP